mgnify:CR=1 FL=1
MKRITFLTGYYGSGKTEIALNLAMKERLDAVVDLDIINPYFRSREGADILQEAGIEIISNDLENGTFADLPFLSKTAPLPAGQNVSLFPDEYIPGLASWARPFGMGDRWSAHQKHPPR